jgi:hypothetical protein
MRLGGVIAALVLVAGCSHPGGSDAQKSQPSLSARPSTAHSAPSSTAPTSTAAKQAPGPGAPIADVITFIEAASPADPGTYHVATRDGEPTQLGGDVAFTTPSNKMNCMTDSKYSGGALACLVALTNPPKQPDDVYGEWKGNWIDYDGSSVRIGSVHGDPGRFAAGSGPELPYGQAIAFGDYRCRSDPAGLFCVNYAHRSAARFSASGVEPFGCLKPTQPNPQIGQMFGC